MIVSEIFCRDILELLYFDVEKSTSEQEDGYTVIFQPFGQNITKILKVHM